MKKITIIASIAFFAIITSVLVNCGSSEESKLDKQLTELLRQNDFDGKIQEELEKRLGRKIDMRKVELGKLVFFDNGLGLHQDNSCAGCHSPSAGFGDSQPIAIGVENNDTVGIDRKGTRNQRRTPTVVNTVFYPKLMWNGRFASLSGNPFDNSKGFDFPPPEVDSIFNVKYDYVKNINHLLVAQGHMPFTEQPEMAGFTSGGDITFASFSRFSGLMKEMQVMALDGGNIKNQPLNYFFKKSTNKIQSNAPVCKEIDFSDFNDGDGLSVPAPDPIYGSANYRIRSKVLDIINKNTEYKNLFGEIYPEVKSGSPINFIMMGEVLAEFEYFLTFAQSPLDNFAVGNTKAMTIQEKRGAVIFFTNGNCVSCHSVKGESNQMFSDFEMHNVGTPQIYPVFGKDKGNVPFSDLNCLKSDTGRLDFGREEFTGNQDDRYKFRSSPLRNLQTQPFYFHNGAFNDLEKAVVFHLNPKNNISTYDPSINGVPNDLKYNKADMADVMTTLDPLLLKGINLTQNEIDDLVAFLRTGLYDNRTSSDSLKRYIPLKVPTGIKVSHFQ